MPQTIHSWTRVAGGPIAINGFPSNAFTPIATAYSPFSAFVPWTLLRTDCELIVSANVKASSGLKAINFIGANMRLGLKHSPDSTDPGLQREDESPQVLGMRHLVPELSGDPANVGGYSVVCRLLSQFENRTSRSAEGHNLSAVYAYIWAEGDGPSWDQPNTIVDIQYSYQLSTLWGR